MILSPSSKSLYSAGGLFLAICLFSAPFCPAATVTFQSKTYDVSFIPLGAGVPLSGGADLIFVAISNGTTTQRFMAIPTDANVRACFDPVNQRFLRLDRNVGFINAFNTISCTLINLDGTFSASKLDSPPLQGNQSTIESIAIPTLQIDTTLSADIQVLYDPNFQDDTTIGYRTSETKVYELDRNSPNGLVKRTDTFADYVAVPALAMEFDTQNQTLLFVQNGLRDHTGAVIPNQISAYTRDGFLLDKITLDNNPIFSQYHGNASGIAYDVTNGDFYVLDSNQIIAFRGPSVSAVSPPNGVIAGGTHVQISGKAFPSDPVVTFGGTVAANVVVASSGLITCDTPAHAPGVVDVIVSSASNSIPPLTLKSAYTYINPTIATITPASGFAGGGTHVTITGTDLPPDPAVTFGGVAAANVVFLSSTQITCDTPANPAGPVDVVVSSKSNLIAPITAPAAFTYTNSAISAVTPNKGPSIGGTQVQVTGMGFASDSTVTFGGTPAASVVFVSSTQLTCVTPGHVPGPADVTVASASNAVSPQTLAAGFTFLNATLTGLAPKQGTVLGGTSVQITGQGLPPDAVVTFGGVAAGVAAATTTVITCSTPAHAPGFVDVVVSSRAGFITPLTLPNAYNFTNAAPTAVLTPDVTQGAVPLTVNFDTSASSDSDGTIVRRTIDFGDGSFYTFAPGETSISHTYTLSDTFTATLSVFDNFNAAGVAGATIVAGTGGSDINSVLIVRTMKIQTSPLAGSSPHDSLAIQGQIVFPSGVAPANFSKGVVTLTINDSPGHAGSSITINQVPIRTKDTQFMLRLLRGLQYAAGTYQFTLSRKNVDLSASIPPDSAFINGRAQIPVVLTFTNPLGRKFTYSKTGANQVVVQERKTKRNVSVTLQRN